MTHTHDHHRERIDWFDYATITCIVLTIAFAAAAYGGVVPWSELVLAAASSVLVALSCVQIARGRVRRGMLPPMAVLGVFALVVLLQATPIPASITGLLSPNRFSAESVSQAANEHAIPLSYNPLATSHGLRLFVIGLVVFAVAGLTAQERPQQKALLFGLFLVGVFEAALALAQLFFKAEGIYWSDLSLGGVRSGSFINHSNFSQFLNLTAGAGLGYLLICFSEKRHKRKQRSRPEATAADLFRENWFPMVGLALHAVALAGSLSRGGLLGMMAGTCVIAFLLGRQQSLGWRSWVLFALPPLVFAGMVLIGFDKIYERLGTLEDKVSYADRWELGVASLRAAGDHLAMGAGLDTYQYVFPQYDTTGSAALAEQADNDYAQLLVEIGLAGACLVLAFLLLVSRAVWRGLTNGRGHSRYAFYGVVYALVAIAVQCVSDFGQRLPAVFCVTAAMTGVCFVLRSRSGGGKGEPRDSSKPRWILATCVLLVSCPLCAWLVRESWQDYQAERWFSIAFDLEQRLGNRKAELDLQSYVDRVVAAEKAFEIRPTNLEYAFWLNIYRWQYVVAASGVSEAQFAQSEEGREITLQIADEFRNARRLCPVYGPAYTVEGNLRLLAGDPSGETLVLRGAELNPNNTAAVLAAVRVQATSEDTDVELLKTQVFHSVSVNGASFGEAVGILVDTMGRVDWAQELAGQDAARLTSLARLLTERDFDPTVVEDVQRQANQIDRDRVLEGTASPGEFAREAAKLAAAGEHGAATDLYLKALARSYGNLQWRLALVDQLIATEQFGEAERHARIAVRLAPGNTAARRKLEEVSLLVPAASEKK